MANEFVFLPWTRTPLGARAVAPASGGARPRVPIGLQVSANGADQGTAAITDIDLYAAGDISAVDPSMIVRVEPVPGTRGIEPNYFPLIEFADADFAWRYTLDTSRTNRLRPWIALIALRPEEFRYLPRVPDALPAIEVASPMASLPDLSHAWAWAHTQVNTAAAGTGAAAVANVVRSEPAAHFCRIMCPRRLRPETSYHLFLVPTYEAGRLTGLRLEGTANPWNAPAWTGIAAALQLPYYAVWTFTTSQDEDFESLVRRLAPRDLDAVSGSGLRGAQIRGGETGYFPAYQDPSIAFEAEGALRTPRADDVRRPFAVDSLTPRLVNVLTSSIAPLATIGAPDSESAEDPLFSPPAYGHLFRRSTAIRPPPVRDAFPSPNPWLHETNLDRRYRLAAGIGARVVRKHQEQFMAAAWAQAGAIADANRLIALAHAAERVHDRMTARYTGVLDPALTVTLAEPVLAMIRYPGTTRTIAAELERNGLPAGVLTVPERRAQARRPAAVRRTGERRGRRRVAREPSRMATPGADYGAPALAREPAAERRRLRLSWTATVFPQADRAAAQRLLNASVPATTTVFAQRSVDSGTIKNAVLSYLRTVPALRVSRQVGGLDDGEAERLEPVLRGPRIPDPMYRYLAEQDASFLLPGIRQLPDETIGLLVENDRFIEAFLLGANHEMNRELLWREFPSDMRTTVFSRFWDRGMPPEDEAADEIRPIHEWSGRLGTHGRAGRAEDLVLVVRGELVRRFPEFVVALNRQRVVRGGNWRPDAGETILPRFWGSLQDDVRMFGFPLTEAELRARLSEYFFVIYEPAGRYRFGLDVATHAVRRTRRDPRPVAGEPFPLLTLKDRQEHRVKPSESPTSGGGGAAASAVPASWNDLSWSHVRLDPASYVDPTQQVHPTADDAGQWGAQAHAASLASVTFQRPIRIVVPARRMLYA
jgi:hypothetical protein